LVFGNATRFSITDSSQDELDVFNFQRERRTKNQQRYYKDFSQSNPKQYGPPDRGEKNKLFIFYENHFF